MKRLLRWMLRPVVQFLVRNSASAEHVIGTTTKGMCVSGVCDPFGIMYLNEYTPEEFREHAWRMIGMADRVEAEREFV